MGFFSWFKKRNESIGFKEITESKIETSCENPISHDEMMERFSQLFLKHSEIFNENVPHVYDHTICAYRYESHIKIGSYLKELSILYDPKINKFRIFKGNSEYEPSANWFSLVEKYFDELHKDISFSPTERYKLVEYGIVDMKKDYFSADRFKTKFKISDCGKIIVSYNGYMEGPGLVLYEKKYSEKFNFDYVDKTSLEWCFDHIENFKSKKWSTVEFDSIESFWVEECLNSEVMKRFDNEQKMIVHIIDVMEKHEKYVNTATTHGLIVPVPIRNYDSYISFCNLLNIQTNFKNWEIENYLRSVGKYCPNK